MSSRSASALLEAALAVPFDPEEEDRRQLALAQAATWDSGPVPDQQLDIAPENVPVPQLGPDPLVQAADAAMVQPGAGSMPSGSESLRVGEEQGVEPPLPQADEDLPPVGGAPRRSASALLADIPDAAVDVENVRGPGINLPRAEGTLDAIGNAITRGLTMNRMGRAFEEEAPDADRVLDLQRQMREAPASAEFQAAMNDDLTPQESWQAFKAAPVKVMGELLAESFSAFLPQMFEKAPARVLVGAGLGGGTALAAGQAGPQVAVPEEVITVPAGAAIGARAGYAEAAGAASFTLEMAGGILEGLEQAGVAMDNPEALREALEDPERMQLAREFAMKKAVPVAAFDAASALIAGRLAGKRDLSRVQKILRGAGETLIQSFMGAGGEAAGQLAQKGEISSVRSVMAEGLAETATGGLDIAAGVAFDRGETGAMAAGQGRSASAMLEAELGQQRTAGPAVPTGEAAAAATAPVQRVVVEQDDVFGEATTTAVEEPAAAAAPVGDERFAPPVVEQPAPQPAMAETAAPVVDPTVNPYRDAEGEIQIPFRASSNFDPTLQQFEDRMRATANDPVLADETYNAIPSSKGGKVIGTDIARELLPEYAAGRQGKIDFVNATGRVAQAYAKDRLWREINNRGDRKILMFTAGGVAAGKSTAVTDQMVASADLVFDGTLRETEWAKQTIRQALNNGWEVEVNYVQRPLNLVARGAIRRAQEEGRWGPYESVPETHAGAQRSIVDLSKEFAGDSNIRFNYFLNSGRTTTEPGVELTLKDIDKGGKYSYDAGDERVSQRQNLAGRPNRRQAGQQSEQPAQSGQEGGGGGAFAWRVRGYSPAEHLEIFREAARSGDVESGILRRLAAGNPALEQAVDEAAPAQAKRNIQRKLRPDSGAIDVSILEDIVEYGQTVYRAGMQYATWAAAMVKEFGQGVAQFLRQAFDRIVAAYRNSRFSDTTGAVGDVRPGQRTKPRQLEEKAMRNEALAAETRARLGSEYLPISLNAQAAAAKEWINTNGLDAAKLRIAQLSGEDAVPTPLDFAIGIEAAGRLSAAGDHQGAADIVSTMSHRATGMGQTISTLAMMARLSPEGIVFYGENIIKRYINALPPEAQERIRALQAEVARLKAELAQAKFDQGSEVIRSGKLGDEKIQDRIKRRQRAKVEADLGPGASGPEVTAETRARVISMNRAVRDVLLGDSTKAEATKAIEAILLEQGNLSASEAAAMAKSIAEAFFKLMRETRTRLTNEAKGRGGRAGGFDRLLAMLREGKEMSDADFLGSVAQLLGLPGMTPAMARELRAIGQRYERATDPDVRLVLAGQMYEKAHELVPADFWVKVRGFAYLSMLFAPKTWIRNVVGNQIQWIANVGRDAFVTGILDPALSLFTGQRTSAGLKLGPRLKGLLAPIADVRRGYLWNKQENPSANFRQNVAAGVNHLRLLSKLTTQNKYEISDVRNVAGRIFSSRFMRMWEGGLSIALGAGDRAFWMSQFRASLAQMQAAAEKNGEWSGQPTPEMIEAAMAEAAYAIYQNPNILSQQANRVRTALNKVTTFGRTDQYGLGTVLMAFTQVPGSLTLRGLIEWSPLGFIPTLYRGMRGLLYASSDGRRGAKFDQAAFNKEFTQALIGTGAFYAAGYYLYAMGIITASREDDEDLEAMRRASGLGAYRINLTALRRALVSGNWFTRQEPQDGDLIASYDWAQPVAFTVAAGAEFAAQVERANRQQLKKNLADRAGMAAISMVAGAKSLEELPLLSGLMSFMGAIGQRPPPGESRVMNAMVKTITGAPSMFVPQLVRQATQLSDNAIRTTRAGDAAQREFDRIVGSLPGMSTKFPRRFDVTGQAIERYQYDGNTVANVLLNPALTSRYKADPVLQELGRLLNATGDAGMVPRQVMRKAKINGQDVELTNNQIAAYQYYVGNLTMSHFRWRMAAPVYARLPDEVKAKMLADDLTDIHSAVKSAVLGHDPRRLTRKQRFLRQALVNSPLGRSVPPR